MRTSLCSQPCMAKRAAAKSALSPWMAATSWKHDATSSAAGVADTSRWRRRPNADRQTGQMTC